MKERKMLPSLAVAASSSPQARQGQASRVESDPLPLALQGGVHPHPSPSTWGPNHRAEMGDTAESARGIMVWGCVAPVSGFLLTLALPLSHFFALWHRDGQLTRSMAELTEGVPRGRALLILVRAGCRFGEFVPVRCEARISPIRKIRRRESHVVTE